MTREQMIAWLLLEGWTPYGDATGGTAVWVHKDGVAAYSHSPKEEGLAVWNADVSNHGKCEWVRFKTAELRRIFDVVRKEKDHAS